MAGKRRGWSTPITTGNTTAAMGADRQAIFQELHDALIAIGLTQTSDTGQLADFSGVTADAPGATGVNYGYRVYQLNDSLQAVSPIFLRVEYRVRGGSSSGSWDIPNFGLSIGTGTDGAGNLANASANYLVPNYYATSSAATPSAMGYTGNLPSYAYHGEGLLWVVLKGGGFRALSYGATYIGRPGTSPNSDNDFPLLFFAIARPVGPDGQPKAGGAAIVVPQSMGDAVGSSGTRYSVYAPVVAALSSVSGASRVTRTPLNKPAADVMATAEGNLVVGTLHAKFDTGLEQLYGIGSVSAAAVSRDDTISVNLHGLDASPLFIPHRGVPGFSVLAAAFNSADGDSTIDTPALVWEGDFA
ncbi:TPA: hypothetical protein ACXJUT_001928 [Pseudomonas aeruginosa]